MIKLCILQAGEFTPDMDASVPRYEPLYRTMFSPFPHLDLSFFRVRDDIFPDDINDFDAFLITGSAAGTYDELSWITTLKSMILDIHQRGKPLVGICFGHQIIADALGGVSEKSSKGWGLGVRRTSISNHKPWMAELGTSFDLLYVHQDQVMTLPDEAILLASNHFCPNAAFSVGETIFCIQGHPEFTSHVVDSIIDLRLEKIGSAVAEEAKSTLSLSHDGEKMAHVITQFIEHALNPSPSP